MNGAKSRPAVPNTYPTEEPSPREIAVLLRAGSVLHDEAFDQYLPHDLRLASSEFWTPLQVARTVGSWLTEVGARTVVDVGAGPGKFCVVASLVTECLYFGIEHRPRLVATARSLARRFGVERRVSFIEGAFGNVSIEGVDAVYLYNPFAENLCWYDAALDETVELGPARFRHDVALVENLLEALPMGTYLITYNGFGGRVPDSFIQLRADRGLPNVLCMWRKAASRTGWRR
jgi:hypothetical protein